jgi:hypothetical protein
MTRRRTPEALVNLWRRFGADRRFVMEEDMASSDSFFESDVMISDWSGVALEYAFCTERPVLFVDVPRKVNNPEYEQIAREPIEIGIREKDWECGYSFGGGSLAVLSSTDLSPAPIPIGRKSGNFGSRRSTTSGVRTRSPRERSPNWPILIPRPGDKAALRERGSPL